MPVTLIIHIVCLIIFLMEKYVNHNFSNLTIWAELTVSRTFLLAKERNCNKLHWGLNSDGPLLLCKRSHRCNESDPSDAFHASSEAVGSVGKADGRHVGAQASRAGQLDQGDIIVDGLGVPAGVSEDLREVWREGKVHALKEVALSVWIDAWYLSDSFFKLLHLKQQPAADRCVSWCADLTLQWAAVTTHCSLIRDPPQKWKPLVCCEENKSKLR